MKKILIIAVLAVTALQLAVPVSMVRGRERTLREGEVFKFKVAPVDPYDAFRGRYVRLNIMSPELALHDVTDSRRARKELYAILAIDSNGYAYVAEATRAAPQTGAYVRATAWVQGNGRGRVQLPIKRFYLPEDEAPAAERAIPSRAASSQHEAAVVVRVRNGDLVVEDLLIGDQPIRAWLPEQADKELNE